MVRLLQGDVGSGKTIVAMLAILQAIESGFQTAMMVPTSILAQQHFNNIQNLFKKLNINKMQKESSYFIGKHDFNAFRSINCQSSSSIKTIDSFDTYVQDENIRIKVKAKSFLHSQVRIMVGTLVDIGKGKISSVSIKDIINNKDRDKAGVTAPACGLYLIEVGY